MIECPFCGAENTEGADLCNDCQHSLTDLSFPSLNTPVEVALMSDRIERLDPKTPFSVTPDTPVGEVLNSMIAEGIGCVMVVDNGQLQGIFTEVDAVRRIGADAATMANRAIGTLMTPSPVTLQARDKIAYAVHKMHVGGYRHLPIMDAEQLVGVISIRDILGYLAARIGVPA